MERIAQCHCGTLRATTSGEPLLVAICHCKACQQRTGALAASVAGFAKAQVTIEGQTKVFDRYGESGRKVRFYFCPNCGTSLYWEADGRPGSYILAVGAFADPNFPPAIRVHIRRVKAHLDAASNRNQTFPGSNYQRQLRSAFHPSAAVARRQVPGVLRGHPSGKPTLADTLR